MNTAYNFLKEYIPVRDAFKTREDGEFLIVSNCDQAIYYFNSMARKIWNMFDGHISIDEVCIRILEEYAVLAVVAAVNEVSKLVGDNISAFAPEALQPCLD